MKDNKNKQVICDCGKTHSVQTQKVVVQNNAFSILLKDLSISDYKNILFLSGLQNTMIEDCLKVELEKVGKVINIISVSPCKATKYEAEKIKDYGQDVVVALGGEEVISISKYYAYCYECDLFVFSTGNFVDFTFSKFARLFDGVEYHFYLTCDPKQIYIDTNRCEYNVYQTYYIASKFLVLFDNYVQEAVFEKIPCSRIRVFLTNTLKEYSLYKVNSKQELNVKNIWTLVRLGQAMSFFESTSVFFAGDLAIANLLHAQKISADFLEIESIAVKLIVNMYSLFFKRFPAKMNTSLNKQIQTISKLLKITPTEVLKRVVDSKMLNIDGKILNKFNNYFPYLAGMYSKYQSKVFKIHSGLNISTNVLKKYGFTANRVEKSVAVSPLFFNKPCTLHILLQLGYLDKLL